MRPAGEDPAREKAMFWDRANHPIMDTIEWAKLFEDPGYRFLALDIDEVDGERYVSTIWQGMDLSRSLSYATGETAWIFETAYFINGALEDRFLSVTEEGALHMHDGVCWKFLHRPARPEDGHLQEAIKAHRPPSRG